jgi:hypothetical protein
MQDPKKTIYARKAETVIKALARQNIEAQYYDTKEQAIAAICKMIPAGKTVGLGGSTTVVESGLADALRELDINLLDRYKAGVTSQQQFDMRIQGLTSHVFIASSNAITMDGKIVNEDGLGNRVASMIFGPEKVILMVGCNKIVPTMDDAISRIKNVCAPFNSIRFNVDTPCSRLGFCDADNCTPPKRICSQIAIIESNAIAGRMNIIFVGEDLGY